MKDGILIVNKPKGLTSNDVVMKIKRKFHMREVGHTGTLDPDVEGVLVVCLGKMTKLVPFLMSDEKVYTGIMCLGYSTDTEDASGVVKKVTPIKPMMFSTDAIKDAFTALEGKLMQRPPMYSAVKVKGRPLYEYARRGEIIDVPEREIMIYSFRQTGELQYKNETLEIPFYARVGHGTYIRTLCVQFGQKLGVESHMKELSRVQNGSMHAKEAIDLQHIIDDQHPEQYIQSGLSVLNKEKWQVVELCVFNETVRFKIMNGAKLTLDTPHFHPHTVITSGGSIVSFYEETEQGYRCVRGIFEGVENGTYHH